MKFVSTTGGGIAVDFEKAILDGFASDGGLYIPESLPEISKENLIAWKNLSFTDLAFEVLSKFIDRSILSEAELKSILSEAYKDFEKEDIIPIYKTKSKDNLYIMELFYGPTLSFKDVGLAFLVTLVNFFLKRKNEFLSLIVATTGDTGPAAAHFTAGKSNLDAWVLYPKGMITEEQERQITTLENENIHPVSVSDCPEGGDDLDAVITKLFANKEFKDKVKLSSVNSINWGRIMMQTVHYIYGYLQVTEDSTEKINVSVPSGGFGNLCAGSLAREMGLPIDIAVIANNKNACLNRIFTKGIYSKLDIIESASNAIDILIPINFWRYLYYKVNKDASKIKAWLAELNEKQSFSFDDESFKTFKKGFLSYSANDDETLGKIKEVYENENYLLDPHASVSLVAAKELANELSDYKIICLATAHPAKFPKIIMKALETDALVKEGMHPSIESEKLKAEKKHNLSHETLEEDLIELMKSNWDKKGNQ